jgi:hypothetical protein
VGSRKQPTPPPSWVVYPKPPEQWPDPPPAREDLFARLDSFRDLEPGWDGYGAPAIDPRAIAKAKDLLRPLTVVPTSRGGVQIEMGDAVELEIGPTGIVWEIG